jgi:hypothetical protein
MKLPKAAAAHRYTQSSLLPSATALEDSGSSGNGSIPPALAAAIAVVDEMEQEQPAPEEVKASPFTDLEALKFKEGLERPPSGRNQTDDSRHRASHRDCFVAPLLAMTAIWGVIASEAKQSR